MALPFSPTGVHKRHIVHRGPFRKGQKVLVWKPQVLKGHSLFLKPLSVQQVLGNWTYLLTDGKIWNARKLKHYYEPQLQWAHLEPAEPAREEEFLVPEQCAAARPQPRRSQTRN